MAGFMDVFKNLRNQQNQQNSTWSNFTGGGDAFKYILDQLKNGIDPKQRAMIEGQGAGQIAGGTQAINEASAGSGGSVGNKLAGLTALRSNVGKNTQNTLLQGDMNAKNNAFSGLLQGGGLNADIGQKNRALNMQQKAYDDANDFSFGDLLGGAFGAAGQIGSAAASKGGCCFIFMEAYNGNMPYWVRECRDEFAPENTARRDGYINMAKWLVPLMQKSTVVRSLVNLLMIKPLTKWGGWYKKVKGYENGFIYKPFVKFWFKVWETK